MSYWHLNLVRKSATITAAEIQLIMRCTLFTYSYRDLNFSLNVGLLFFFYNVLTLFAQLLPNNTINLSSAPDHDVVIKDYDA